MKNPNEFDEFCFGCVIMGVIMLIGAMVMTVPTVGGDSMALLTWCCLIIALIRLVLYWMGFGD